MMVQIQSGQNHFGMNWTFSFWNHIRGKAFDIIFEK